MCADVRFEAERLFAYWGYSSVRAHSSVWTERRTSNPTAAGSNPVVPGFERIPTNDSDSLITTSDSDSPTD